jgi:hypothetical protein
MSFKLTGAIKMIADTNQVSEKFSKRDFVVTDNSSMYPQDIMFQITQDKCSVLDAYSVGDQVEVSFNLRGREWQSPTGEVKYFNTLEAWRIERASGVTPMSPTPTPLAPVDPLADAEDDDLPFNEEL